MKTDIGIAPSYFTRHVEGEAPVTLTEAIDLCVRHGFSALMLPSTLPKDKAEAIAQKVKESGAYVHQTHLPYYRYQENVDYGEVGKKLLLCAESSYALGTEIIVAHADEFDFSVEYTPVRALEFNRRLFDPVVNFAAKHGMKLAFENVFEDMGRGRYGSTVEELCTIVDGYGVDTVGICWDFGHAKMQYPEAYKAAFDTASDRVICTHVHDNHYGKDLHLAPFLGNTDWAGVMEIYRRKCPRIPLTLEMVYGTLPRALHESFAAFLSSACKRLLTE